VAGELRVHRRPELERPVLIAAFRGWNDGAQAASLAAGYLAKTWQAQRFAHVDPEEFFDFQATRPHVSLEGGMTRKIDWPETVFYHARPDGLDRDVVLLLGIEPNLRWRTFTDLVVQLVKELGVEMMITLGALLADVPHSRPSPVTGSASDPDLVRQLGLSESRYEGPTGIVGVLHDACRRAEIPSLCDRLSGLLGISIPAAELEEAAQAYEQQVSDAVASDEETAAYVEELEQRVESLEESPDLPSGDALAAELTRFLRERDEENGSGEDAAREQ
jgi:proteasome assembly chaperone (PAC2) family protein